METIDALNWSTGPAGITVTKFTLLGDGVFLSVPVDSIIDWNISEYFFFRTKLFGKFSELFANIAKFGMANLTLVDGRKEINFSILLDTSTYIPTNISKDGLDVSYYVSGGKNGVVIEESIVEEEEITYVFNRQED